jgi:hypothetical protein
MLSVPVKATVQVRAGTKTRVSGFDYCWPARKSLLFTKVRVGSYSFAAV